MLTGCSFPLDDYRSPAKNDAALSTGGGDATSYDETSDAAAADAGEADEGVILDAATDACVCVHELKGSCKQWSPPGCGR